MQKTAARTVHISSHERVSRPAAASLSRVCAVRAEEGQEVLLMGSDGQPLSDDALRASHGDAAAGVQLRAADGAISQCVPWVHALE